MYQQTEIRIVFQAKCTLRSLLTRVKGKLLIEQVKCVVYKVSYECGEMYIGGTGRICKGGTPLS